MTPAGSIPNPTPEEAERRHLAEMRALVTQLRELKDDEWLEPTDCERWRVRDVVAHIVAVREEIVRARTFVRHWALQGRRRYPDMTPLDAANECGVDDRRDALVDDLIVELERLGPRAARKGRRTVLRRLTIPNIDPLLGGLKLETLFDVILLRDLLTHRIDIARATDRSLVPGEHTSTIVAGIVRDIGRSWSGPAIELELVGDLGGRFSFGEGTPEATIKVDAIEYLRSLSGRDDDPAIEGDESAVSALRSARVAF